MTDASAVADIVAVGEAMVEFNATRAEDPNTYVRGFGGDTGSDPSAVTMVLLRT